MPDFPFPMPVTASAMVHAALLTRESWIAAAEARHVSEAYIRGLSQPGSVVYPWQGDPLSALVINLWTGARQVEQGVEAYHLPSRVHWGSTPASRRSKRGTWYIRIPFRHGTPGAQRQPMPRRVYAVAKQLQGGQWLTAGPTHGPAVHTPGLSPYQPRNPLNVRPGYQHASIYEGMRRIPAARGRGGSYLTFRTMTPQSPGWHMPMQPGKHIARDVRQQTAAEVRRLLETAVRADIEQALRHL